jgi:hypothetical protein
MNDLEPTQNNSQTPPEDWKTKLRKFFRSFRSEVRRTTAIGKNMVMKMVHNQTRKHDTFSLRRSAHNNLFSADQPCTA